MYVCLFVRNVLYVLLINDCVHVLCIYLKNFLDSFVFDRNQEEYEFGFGHKILFDQVLLKNLTWI